MTDIEYLIHGIALDSGCWMEDTGNMVTDNIDLVAFSKSLAKLAAQVEREACAKIVASKKYYHIPRKNQLWLVLLEIADDIRKQGQLNTGIEKLGLNVRTEHHLKAEDIFSIEQLECCTEDRLLKTPNIGSKSLKEIKEQMAKFGYKLRDKNE